MKCDCCDNLIRQYMGVEKRPTRSLVLGEDARQWATGLQELLKSSYGTALFRAFLQREYAEENLDFVLKVERFRSEGSPRKRHRMAWKLYTTYVVIGSNNELNLDVLTRRVTELAMITPHISTFDVAQKRIAHLLECDAYVRFLNWDVYKSLIVNDDNNKDDNDQGKQDQAKSRGDSVDSDDTPTKTI